MKRWLVTVVTGDIHSGGPAVLVAARTAQEAATLGLQHLMEDDSGSHPWGVQCQQCERAAVISLHVYAQDQAAAFEINQKVEPCTR